MKPVSPRDGVTGTQTSNGVKIVIATPFYPPEGGILGVYAKGLKEAFERRGDTVVVVSTGFSKSLPVIIRHVAYFFSLVPHVRGADLVLALDTWSVGMPAFFAAYLSGAQYSVRIGGDFLWEAYVERRREHITLSEFYIPRHYSLKERFIFRSTKYITDHADILFFTTKFQSAIWQKAYSIDPKKIAYLENFFPPHIPAERREKPYRFVHTGRPIFLKNVPALERAFARVREKRTDIELDISYTVPENQRERVAGSYAVLIPSFSEVCSNAAIEAMELGVPFIMTSDTGTSERLNGCGLFVDTRSDEELARAIERMLDPAEYETLRTNIAAFSFTHSWDDMAKEIVAAV